MKTYMFCNAHLDPVWLWRWDEGLGETLSTFRAAADFVDEYPDFVFNHNESVLYEWIEEHDPELFERIRRQVGEGRWEIVGGWFLQPDCNIPSGESIYRQVLRGRLYFYDKFGKVPVTAINMDPFGHAHGLVQMLEQCGYKYYVNIRPGKENYDFKSEDFVWKGYNGSEVIVHRSDKGYNSVYGKAAEELATWTEERKDEKTALYLWGVGNHGGGPSRKDLNDIAELQKEGMDLIHSRPDDYFATLDREALPVVERGLNPVAEGCYTSIVRIKQMHRQLENDLVMVEKMAAHAEMAGLSTYEKKKLDDAWRDLLFAEFHDSLPGSCIAPVEEDTIRLLNHGLEITAQLKAKYLIALSAGQKKLEEGTVPIIVYNPHPFTYRGPIDVQFVLPRQLWHKKFSNPVVYQDGKPLRCQSAKEDGNFYMDWCKRVVFDAELPATTLSRFDVHFEVLDARPAPELAADRSGKITIKTERGQVIVNANTGLVDSYVLDGREYLKPGAMAVEVYNDSFNSWGGQPGADFVTPIGRFAPMPAGEATDFAGVKGGIVQPVRVTDEGDLRVVVEADMKYGASKLLMRYIVDKKTGTLEVETRLFNEEKEKRVKLVIPTTFEDADYIGQTIFAREKLNVRAEGDYMSQYWQAVADADHALTIIDNGIYGSNFVDGRVGLTLLRSAGYGAARSAWDEPFHEPMYQQRMDQGERRYRFLLMAGAKDERMLKVDREAAAFNQMPYALPFCPSGRGVAPKALVSIEKDNVALSCLKQSERDEKVYILRVFESQGMPVETKVELPVLGISTVVKLNAFEIKTFKVTPGQIVETDMLEGIIEK